MERLNLVINKKFDQHEWETSNPMIVGNPGKAGGGGLICDHQGKWIKGYMRHIDVATSIIAKFWALRDGLMLAS